MKFLPALAVLGVVLGPPAARAEEPAACPAKAAILALSDTVLAGRTTLPRLKARGFGAEAAYLQIRYGGLAADAATALVHGLREAGVREAIDLAGAFDASRGGFDAVPKDATSPAQFGVQISTLRAILLHGDAEKLLAAIAALPSDQQIPVSQRIVPAILDWPDARKAELAEAAGRHGLFFLQAGRKTMHTVWVAAAREPERDFLMTYLNQTGDVAATAKAAQALLAEIDGGRIRPEGRFDPAWLAAYRALRSAATDPAAVDAGLAAIPFHGGRYLRTGGDITVREVIDRLVAAEALTSYLKGEAVALPDMPAELSAAFQPDWPLWAELAGMLKTAPLTALARDEAKAPVVAELLFAAGDHARLADFILAAEPAETRLSMATDFAMRLDRGCAGAMHHPAEALMLSGQPIFRFDPAQ